MSANTGLQVAHASRVLGATSRRTGHCPAAISPAGHDISHKSISSRLRDAIASTQDECATRNSPWQP